MEDYTNSEMKFLINEYIHKERDRNILVRRLCDGLTYEQLAEEFNLSTQRIKAIVYKGQDKVFKYFKYIYNKPT